MVLSIFLFVVFLIIASGFLFFFFCFFVPALKSKYFGFSNILSTEKNICYEFDKDTRISSDLKKHAVITTGTKADYERRLRYTGLKQCAVFYETYESEYTDYRGCAGFGDCMKVCHQNAIQLENGIAVVTNMCDGCGLCLSACPINCISLADKATLSTAIPERHYFSFWKKCASFFVHS